ncbi:Alpha-ketoglutarate-dependent sulfonate dioxygenase [Wickerhamomyces ciferrii]|uniref:Alpha-ketoglutarate-dependent sulfonate dioxygenase n=1 Tax=Wickerhamomyces ciferrii (strain ATCC 14091 / BCRC 22168 / CBS 111 / JCM 3599 / NBRC 0793 / NRRL Y-1031 F-60-10) TaxID=1206466 RepID=K0KC97_WICCF|nr:Alpha-ketoglutarate-dependent sulfonate dioxygenase [Wickerhamomyces ciferrii]CCH40521.1 Alpha-ketoglutarate-dependent sulfonate dioxygenase [Wickerhamomyces ciferrii]
MAPSATTTATITAKAEPAPVPTPQAKDSGYTNLDIHYRKDQDSVDPKTGILTVGEKDQQYVDYKEWLPTWDPKQKLDPYPEDFNKDFVDRGHYADPEFKNLFPPSAKDSIKFKNLSPRLGTEVEGVQLSQLDSKGKDDLALYVAQRGVVVFRNQDLKDKGLEFNKKFGEHFGPLHIHPSSGAPLDYPEFHITYRRKDPNEYQKVFGNRLHTKGWHSDVTYEKNPPGTTFFAMLQGPESGGDTLFSDTEEAYNRLSPKFKEMIADLKCVHSSYEQAAQSNASGGIERRPPSASIHPLVRTHPVTKKKSLFAGRAFIRQIIGLKQEESDAILNLLTDFLDHSVDLQVRARWEPGSVVVWDNRRLLHSATFDWNSGEVRHCYRITPMAERPQ